MCFTLVAQNLNHPEMIVAGAPPPPYEITWLPFLGATSQKLRARVWIVPQRVCASRRKQEAVPSGEWYGGGNALDAEPAVAAGEHSEMSEVERRTCGLNRMFAFANSLRDTGISLQSPGCGGL